MLLTDRTGENLERKAGIGRLIARGCDIQTFPDTSAPLPSVPEKLCRSEILYGLDTAVLGRNLYVYDHVSSTNDVAFDLAEQGAPAGTTVLAEQQSHGRGRLGRHWYSPLGVGIWCSLILRPKIPPSASLLITMLGAVSVAEVIEEQVALRARLKWPNDVLIDGKKVCGVLSETRVQGDRLRFVVLGIGINVNQGVAHFPGALRETASSLRLLTGRRLDRIDLFRQLLKGIELAYSALSEGACSKLLERWRQLSCTPDGEEEWGMPSELMT